MIAVMAGWAGGTVLRWPIRDIHVLSISVLLRFRLTHGFYFLGFHFSCLGNAGLNHTTNGKLKRENPK